MFVNIVGYYKECICQDQFLGQLEIQEVVAFALGQAMYETQIQTPVRHKFSFKLCGLLRSLGFFS